MMNRVPVPTDNIYKFYALFSLVALVFGIWLVFSITKDTNALITTSYPEIAELKAIKERSPAQSAKLEVLEKQIEVSQSDKDFFIKCLSGIIACCFWLMVFGFVKWHREIQPLADENQKIQLAILKLQVQKLELENKKLSESLPATASSAFEVKTRKPHLLLDLLRLFGGKVP